MVYVAPRRISSLSGSFPVDAQIVVQYHKLSYPVGRSNSLPARLNEMQHQEDIDPLTILNERNVVCTVINVGQNAPHQMDLFQCVHGQEGIRKRASFMVDRAEPIPPSDSTPFNSSPLAIPTDDTFPIKEYRMSQDSLESYMNSPQSQVSSRHSSVCRASHSSRHNSMDVTCKCSHHHHRRNSIAVKFNKPQYIELFD